MFGKKKKRIEKPVEAIKPIEEDKPKRDVYFELTGKRKEEVVPNDKA